MFDLVKRQIMFETRFQKKSKKSNYIYCHQCQDEVKSACVRHREMLQTLTQNEYDRIVEKMNQKTEKRIENLKKIADDKY